MIALGLAALCFAFVYAMARLKEANLSAAKLGALTVLGLAGYNVLPAMLPEAAVFSVRHPTVMEQIAAMRPAASGELADEIDALRSHVEEEGGAYCTVAEAWAARILAGEI